MSKYYAIKSTPVKEQTLNFLLLGESGAGKTSLINLFDLWDRKFNLKDFKNLKRALIKTKYLPGDGGNESGLDNGESQTQKPRVYTFNFRWDKVEYSVKLLDTPGFGDTRGME